MIKKSTSTRKQLQAENSVKKDKTITNPTKDVETPPEANVTSKKDIDKLMNDLNKKFGTNAVILGSTMIQKQIERIPTGSIALDIALGGGIPIGRFTQISGALSSTKTTQSLHVLRNAQKMGLTCALFDVEGTTDNPYLETIGIDTETLIYSRPDGLEECTEMILYLQRSGLAHVALWDSIEASSPTKEQQSAMDETVQMGVKQKLLGEFFRKYQAANNRLEREGKRPFTLIGINQLREKIGFNMGDNEYTPGGRSIGFTATVDMRLRKGDWIAEGTGENKEIVGQVVKCKIEKNKTYKRMQTCEFDFYFAENDNEIPVSNNDNFKSIVIEAIAWGLIERGGAWYTLDAEHKFQGTDKLVEYLREQPHLIYELRDKILALAKDTK